MDININIKTQSLAFRCAIKACKDESLDVTPSHHIKQAGVTPSQQRILGNGQRRRKRLDKKSGQVKHLMQTAKVKMPCVLLKLGKKAVFN